MEEIKILIFLVPSSRFLPIVSIISLIEKYPVQSLFVTFGCHISLVSAWNGFSDFPWLSWPWCFWRLQGLIWWHLMVQVMCVCRDDMEFFPSHFTRWHTALVYLTTDNPHVDLLKVLPSRLLCYKITPSSLIINEYLGGATLTLCTCLFHHQTFNLLIHRLTVSYFIQWGILHYHRYLFWYSDFPNLTVEAASRFDI